MKKLIRDRHGRVLEFSQERVDDLVYFKLEFHGACAAYANCQIVGDVLVLADLFVENECVVRHPHWLPRLFGRKTLEVNFRKQGIGAQLLTTVVAYAKSKGLRRVEYRMVATDPVPDPRILPWYKKQGFTVAESSVFWEVIRAPNDDSRYMPKV